MDNVTIQETFTLPSRGKCYDVTVNPTFSLRSMTTEDEMKRLGASQYPYKTLAEIMDDCMLTDIGISCYDMHLGDYQYVLHRLRVVTYGSDYRVQSNCPFCQNIDAYNIDLDSLDIFEYNEENFDKFRYVTLPDCGKRVELNFQTPRMLDNIEIKKSELRKKNPNLKVDPSIKFLTSAFIKTVDGKKLDEIRLDQMVSKMKMCDTNTIIQYGMRLSTKMGLDTKIRNICSSCGVDYTVPFRVTSEFFGPGIDE